MWSLSTPANGRPTEPVLRANSQEHHMGSLPGCHPGGLSPGPTHAHSQDKLFAVGTGK